MTNNYLIDRTRSLLSDTNRNTATASVRFTDATLQSYLDEAIGDTLSAVQESKISILLNRLIATCAATAGTSVPTDFWRSIAGIDANGDYVPMVDVVTGVMFEDSGIGSRMYVKLNKFWGSAVTAYYFKRPQKVMANDVKLTEFPDGFYHTAKYLAASNALLRENVGSERWKAYMTEYQRLLVTL